jgi:hypothetical protein
MYAGQAVTKGDSGAIGIVTEPARKAGVYKGLVSVMWVGGRYEVTEHPEELTPVKLTIKEEGTK